MPKRKSAEAEVVASVESKKTRSASKPKAAGTTHKHTVKQPVHFHVESPATTQAPTTEQIARLAYSLWEARGYQGGSPEEDWFQAERELLELSQNR